MVPEQYRDAVNLVVGIENDHHKRPIWPGSPYLVQLCQYTVLAKPGHPAIKTLVDQVAKDLEDSLTSKQPGQATTFAEVMGTTGPFAFTKALMDYFTAQTGVEHTGNEVDRLREPVLIGDVLVLPKDSFGWLAQEHTHERDDPTVLVEHLFIGSWRDGHPGCDSRELNRRSRVSLYLDTQILLGLCDRLICKNIQIHYAYP